LKKILTILTILFYLSLTPLFYIVFSNINAGWILLTVYLPMMLMVINSFLFNEKFFIKSHFIRIYALGTFFSRLMILFLLLGHLIIGGSLYLAIGLLLLTVVDLVFMNFYFSKYEIHLTENGLSDPLSAKELINSYNMNKDSIKAKPIQLKLRYVFITKILTMIIVWEPRFYEFAFRNLTTSILVIGLYSVMAYIILLSSYKMIALSRIYHIYKRTSWHVLIFLSDFALITFVILANHLLEGLGTFEFIIAIGVLYIPYTHLWSKTDKQYMSEK